MVELLYFQLLLEETTLFFNTHSEKDALKKVLIRQEQGPTIQSKYLFSISQILAAEKLTQTSITYKNSLFIGNCYFKIKLKS